MKTLPQHGQAIKRKNGQLRMDQQRLAVFGRRFRPGCLCPRFHPSDLGFEEVVEPVKPLAIEAPHKEQGTRRVFRPRDQDKTIGTEVELAVKRTGVRQTSRPPRQRRYGISWRSPPAQGADLPQRN